MDDEKDQQLNRDLRIQEYISQLQSSENSGPCFVR
jgi:hypothetical protein